MQPVVSHVLGPAAFANVLAACGPTLRSLVLDTREIGEAHDLQLEPHFGRFDYVVSQLYHLSQLSLPFRYAGEAFCEALKTCRALGRLALIGAPGAVSADSFRTHLFTALETLPN